MKTVAREDGLVVAYTEDGSGDRTMVFIHGMACDHTDWDAQVPFFSPSSRVLTMELRGHGRSTNPTGEFHVSEMADDIAWACAALGLQKPVIIGHSFGALVTLALGSQYPNLAHALVMLDTAFEMRPALRDQLSAYFDSLTAETFDDDITRQVSYDSSDPGDDPAVVEHNIEMLRSFGFDSFVKMGRAILEYGDARPAARMITSPALYIGSSRPYADPASLRAERPDWYYGQTVGSGHWHQVLVPDQINAMIRDFLVQVDRGYPTPPPPRP